MADYVAGSLSVLFGRKSSDDNPSGIVKLTHVKQMYEEFEPQKRPREVGRKLSTQNEQPAQKSRKRTVMEWSASDSSQRMVKKGRFVYRIPQRHEANGLTDETPEVPEGGNSVLNRPPKTMTNKEAALFRISKKITDKLSKRSEFVYQDCQDGEIKSREKKTRQSKKVNAAVMDRKPGESESEMNTVALDTNGADEQRNFRYYENDPTYVSQTIFVKNLPPKTRRKQIKKIFGSCGDILFVRFANAVPLKSSIPVEGAIKKRSLIKPGTTICAYVVFAEMKSIAAALKLNGIEFEGHHLRVDRRDASPVPPKRSVFCGNLPFDTTDDELWEFFAEAGEVDYVRVVRDNLTGDGKGIAFVVFKESAGALTALELSGKTFKSRSIRITAIEKRRPSESTYGMISMSKNAQVGGSKERINKKMVKKSLQRERKQKGSNRNVNRMSKQKREKLKKNIKREKTIKLKKNIAKKLQGIN
ncbi:nucleolar protein 12-like [Tropilaelaps mercedesae]|uniref:Nucleolar protein 12-like n=1 Tax=Tropilaelaps mercedesae TaxID=418985 RepID=A0A1V9XGF1_9ACAR|nr:nucleolar protein 12-like [Tropilaelaps mercedesae]